jgi:hypothetical protein
MSKARLFTMFAGWIMALYGIRRRSWPGTIVAMSGLALADGAMTIGRSKA